MVVPGRNAIDGQPGENPEGQPGNGSFGPAECDERVQARKRREPMPGVSTPGSSFSFVTGEAQRKQNTWQKRKKSWHQALCQLHDMGRHGYLCWLSRLTKQRYHLAKE